MDPVLPILSILGYWSVVLGSCGGPDTCELLGRYHFSGYLDPQVWVDPQSCSTAEAEQVPRASKRP